MLEEEKCIWVFKDFLKALFPAKTNAQNRNRKCSDICIIFSPLCNEYSSWRGGGGGDDEKGAVLIFFLKK